VGTKKIASELELLFPEANIARFDTDNSKAESLSRKYQDLYDGTINIIVGTQMVAKGLDLPKLSFGGVVLADTGLSMPDYTTNEKIFQLLYQVIGRVGRHTKTSRVDIQTFSPDNPVIKHASSQDYDKYYKWAIKQRALAGYPPFSHLLLLTCSYASKNRAKDAASRAREKIEKNNFNNIQISGPAAAFYERRGKQYRWQLLIRSSSRSALVEIAALFAENPKWTADLDPSSLL